MRCDIVAEGGGVRGIALIGALAALESKGFEFANMAGTSAGAITVALLSAGYSSSEMRQIMTELDFTLFQDGSKWKFKQVWDLMKNLGIHKGDAFKAWMMELLDKKGIKTFGDLAVQGETDPRWRYKLKVIVSDITKKRLLTFPDDAVLFNINPDDLLVADAIRASMSLPFYFHPARIGTSYLSDGGLLSSFPIWLFDSDGEPDWPTFGLLLDEQEQSEEANLIQGNSVTRVFHFGKDLIKTMIKSHDRRFIRPGDFENRTIIIPTGNVGVTEFDISYAKKDKLYHSGKMATNEFIENWEWTRYKSWATKARTK